MAQPAAHTIVCYPHHDEQPGRTFAYVMVNLGDGLIRTDQNGVLKRWAFEQALLPATFTCRAVRCRARRLAEIYQTRLGRGQAQTTPRWSLLRFPLQLRALAERHAAPAADPLAGLQVTNASLERAIAAFTSGQLSSEQLRGAIEWAATIHEAYGLDAASIRAREAQLLASL